MAFFSEEDLLKCPTYASPAWWKHVVVLLIQLVTEADVFALRKVEERRENDFTNGFQLL